MQRLMHQQLTENWWNAYSRNASPIVVLAALSKKGERGNSVMSKILGDDEFSAVGCQILKVFEEYLRRGLTDSLLETMSSTNDVGVNVLHEINYSGDIMMFMRWINFLSNLLDVDEAGRSKSIEAIYQMLNQSVRFYGNPDAHYKLLDLISEDSSDSLHVYVMLVNKLAHYGLASEKVDALQGENKTAREKFETLGKKKSVVDSVKEVLFRGAPGRSPMQQFHLHTKPFVIPYCLDSRELPTITINP